AGVTVDYGLMAQAAEELNPGYLQRVRSGRPWVRVKIAASLDGRTALHNGNSQWISGAASRRDVQAWRARSSAILTGIGTVLADDPALTARVCEPPLQPLRVIVDTHWRTPVSSRVLQHPALALIAGSEQEPIPPALVNTDVHCLPLPLAGKRVDLPALMRALAAREINEIQVEAGATLCGGLWQAGLVDEILLYQAPVLLGTAGPGLFDLGVLDTMQDRTQLDVVESCQVGADLRLRMRPHNQSCQHSAGGA
ncbi:MAG: bifunctional diaminohydroxyphosphoribosylaminopyrimidine deaminase/5-amino-6-(5-phosphoribosylamino)uracil reductase RibD, partial [Lysobacterales bacterium]